MILKDYQAQAIKNLENFLKLIDENKPISEAFKNFWASRDVNVRPPYQNNIPHVPQVCFKVPTGGGKTFMVASSLKVIFDTLAVYTKEQLLAAENFSPAEVNEQLSILVLSYDSFRTSNKKWAQGLSTKRAVKSVCRSLPRQRRNFERC